MAYIFMDESGDLGFDKSKARSSKNFLITFFFCDNPNPFEKIVKKTFLSMPQDKQKIIAERFMLAMSIRKLK